ncbi:MAG: YbaK/EbsC family protein [Candidatus Sedimenticola endophacoides]
MGISITLREYLEEHAASYRIVQHPPTCSTLEAAESAHIRGDQMIKSVLLGDDDSYVMALIPSIHRLDLADIQQLLGRRVQMVPEDEVSSAFSDCETGSIPPFGEAYGIETWVDDRLLAENEVYFESGDHSLLIQLDGGKFRELAGERVLGRISHHL